MKMLGFVIAASFAFVLAVVAACSSGSSTGGPGSGSSSGGTTNTTGQSCTSASQCYPLVDGGVDGGAVHGTVTCLTQGIPSGYCTHTCTQNSDCCAVPGECPYGNPEVCASYESTAQKYCFLSCAASAISPDAGTTDPTTYCQRYASANFTCRSTGGGSQNQQFCGP